MKCMPCVTEYKVNREKEGEDGDATSIDMSKLGDAITEVPVWQQQLIAGQLIVTCVTLPVCYDHIEAREKTEVEKAVEGGHLLMGTGG